MRCIIVIPQINFFIGIHIVMFYLGNGDEIGVAVMELIPGLFALPY